MHEQSLMTLFVGTWQPAQQPPWPTQEDDEELIRLHHRHRHHTFLYNHHRYCLLSYVLVTYMVFNFSVLEKTTNAETEKK